ncbi:MAG TPA: hypothetical protein VN175_06220 [Rhizomicrobium sp.]|nr:hypothetical protein [Rhizomicrobium sp.]
MAVVLPLIVTWPAFAGSIVQPSKPDPLLDGGPVSPCAASPDYAAGIDVNGRPVVQADVAAARVPLPDSIAIPIGPGRGVGTGQGPGPGRNFGPGRGGRAPAGPDTASNRDSTYVVLDGRKLEPLLNPPPCAAVH